MGDLMGKLKSKLGGHGIKEKIAHMMHKDEKKEEIKKAEEAEEKKQEVKAIEK